MSSDGDEIDYLAYDPFVYAFFLEEWFYRGDSGK